ncbi:MAG: SPOR domain-containing protein [Methylococcaceae bacterium]
MSNKKRKQRRNHFSGDWQLKDDPLQLAKDEVINDNIIPVTAITADEDAIDRLLMDASFEVDDESLPLATAVIEDTSPAFDNKTASHDNKLETVVTEPAEPEIDLGVDELLIEPEKPKLTKRTVFSKNKSESQVNDFIKSYFVKRSALDDSDIEIEQKEPVSVDFMTQTQEDDVNAEPLPDKPAPSINTLLEELADKTRKNQLLTYSALGFAGIALISCTILGLWSMEAKSKLTKHSELIDIIEEDVANLNEKTANISNYPRPLAAKPLALPSMSAVNNEPIKTVDTRSASTLVTKPALETNTDNTATALVDETPVPVPQRKKYKKPAPEHETTDTHDKTPHVAEHKKSSKNAEHETDKTNAKERKTAQHKTQADLAQQRNAHKTREAEKVKPVIIEPLMTSTKKDNKNPFAETWVVNIAASKQQDYIKTQAQALAKRGVAVKIIPVIINNGTWYRLRAGSFADKESANAYANKIRHSFNLNSVWVGNQ